MTKVNKQNEHHEDDSAVPTAVRMSNHNAEAEKVRAITGSGLFTFLMLAHIICTKGESYRGSSIIWKLWFPYVDRENTIATIGGGLL